MSAIAALMIGLLAAAPAWAQTAAGGSAHTVILKSDGTVWAMGSNGVGQLGDATTTSRTTPVQVSGLSDIVAVAAGGNHSMAITSTGALYVWGYDGTGTDTWEIISPMIGLTDLSTRSRLSTLACSSAEICALTIGPSRP